MTDNTYNGVIFGIEFEINPIAFTIPIGNGWDIYWYGIIIGIGFLLALCYAYFTAKRYDINIDKMLDVALITTPLAIICARLYYVIFDDEKIESFKDLVGIGGDRGVAGLAIYGAVIGAFLFGGIACKLRKVNILDMFDLAATCFILAQGIGRWGNFFNQEAYGTLTGSTWWGMMSNKTVSKVGLGLVHPCFLYEFVLCILGFIVIDRIGRNRKFKGQLVLTYGIWYGIGRGFIELLRTDSLPIGSLRVSSVLSFVIAISCAIIMYLVFKKKKVTVAETGYTNMFDYDSNDESESVEEIAEETEVLAEDVLEEKNEDGEDN